MLFSPVVFLQISLVRYRENDDIYLYFFLLQKRKFFVYLIWIKIIEASEILILFNISKVTFYLNRVCLSLQNAFFNLYISMWLLFKLFPYSIDLQYFILINICIRIIFIQAFRLMFTSTAVRTSIHFICLCITILFFSFLCWYVSVHDCHDRYRLARLLLHQ